MKPGDVREAFLEQLFEVVEAIIDEKLADDHSRDSLMETRRRGELQQEFINCWSFGECEETS